MFDRERSKGATEERRRVIGQRQGKMGEGWMSVGDDNCAGVDAGIMVALCVSPSL